MADETGYRVTRSGELAAYRVTATGLIRITFPTAGNAGGQSVSFPVLESLIAFYRALKKDLLEEEARQTGTDTGRLFQLERPAVGGVDV